MQRMKNMMLNIMLSGDKSYLVIKVVEVIACDVSPVAMFVICISSLDLGELGVVRTEPDVAVRLPHMVPAKN